MAKKKQGSGDDLWEEEVKWIMEQNTLLEKECDRMVQDCRIMISICVRAGIAVPERVLKYIKTEPDPADSLPFGDSDKSFTREVDT